MTAKRFPCPKCGQKRLSVARIKALSARSGARFATLKIGALAPCCNAKLTTAELRTLWGLIAEGSRLKNGAGSWPGVNN